MGSGHPNLCRNSCPNKSINLNTRLERSGQQHSFCSAFPRRACRRIIYQGSCIICKQIFGDHHCKNHALPIKGSHASQNVASITVDQARRGRISSKRGNRSLWRSRETLQIWSFTSLLVHSRIPQKKSIFGYSQFLLDT